jgi:hypothetical protein
MRKRILYLSFVLAAMLAFSSCAHRDCQGHKKTAKTDMGGWL